MTIWSDEEQLELREIEMVEGQGSLTFDIPAGETRTLSVDTPGVWSAPVTLPDAELTDGRQPTIVLWPAVEVVAEIVVPRETAAPRAVLFDLVPFEMGEVAMPDRAVEVRCDVTDSVLSSCEVPEGRWDARIVAGDLAPHFIWDAMFDGPEPMDLGRLRLRHGGSVFGTLRTENGVFDPDRARIAIRPHSDLVEPANQDRALQLTRVVLPDERGQFEFVGLPPGTYRLTASHPGFVIVENSPVQVERGQWTEIEEPIVLPVPLGITVQVEPWLGPKENPWTVQLDRGSDGGRRKHIAEGTTDDLGSWQFQPVAPGNYLLKILDGSGSSYVEREVQISAASTDFHFEIPVVHVEGQVLFDGEPLPANLWFGGRTGTIKVASSSDEDGDFRVILPRSGEWKVDLRAESPVVESRDLEIQVEPGGDQVAEVVIRVPDTRLHGRVIDEQGRTQKGAVVGLIPYDDERGALASHSDEDGEFEFLGIRPGRYSVEAELREKSSQPALVDLVEDREIAIDLTVKANRHLTGRVAYDGAPLPGVDVIAYPIIGTGAGVPALGNVRTRADGTFVVQVPANAQSVRLVVRAPGFALEVTEAPMTTEPHPVNLSRQRGVLELRGDDLSLAPQGGKISLVLVNGAPVDLPTLYSWREIQGTQATPTAGNLVIPGMPPGTYRLCQLSFSEALAVFDGVALPRDEACSSGELAPDTHLALDLPTF